tara:strand:+ start:127 stop:366 length:240 start_codon:yes stop_codon:yes gene_type:complete
MSKKKSYMDHKNLMSEGLIGAIVKMIMKGKGRELQKRFKDNPTVSRQVSRIQKEIDDLNKAIEKSRKTGKPIPKMKFRG